MHGHKCGTCGRSWRHDPLDWLNRPELASSQALHEHTVLEHTCCGAVWVDHWPPPWPLHVLGPTVYAAFARRVRLTRLAAAIVVATFTSAFVQAYREAQEGRPS